MFAKRLEKHGILATDGTQLFLFSIKHLITKMIDDQIISIYDTFRSLLEINSRDLLLHLDQEVHRKCLYIFLHLN